MLEEQLVLGIIEVSRFRFEVIMKIAYFDCFAGAGADMIVAALLDAGLSAEFLAGQLETLGIKGLRIDVSRVSRCGISAAAFRPEAPDGQPRRALSDITEIVRRSGITASAKERAIAIFAEIAAVEAKIHDTTPEKVHFHEIGAVDSIVDVVSACVGIEAMGIDKVYCSVLSVGSGAIDCDHGRMPAPSPATIAILARAKVPAAGKSVKAELLTPTAAAILTNLAEQFGTMPEMTIDAAGYGAGTREIAEFANVLRVVIGESVEGDDAEADTVCVLETNVDDVTGEAIGYARDLLMEAGALDMFTTAVQGKCGRPASMLSVICKLDQWPTAEQILFEHGLTFGIRRRFVQRSKLAREFVTVETKFGSIRVKVGTFKGRQVAVKAEFADCAAMAKLHNVALKVVQDAAIAEYRSRKDNK